jgi:hypothetical protein
LHLLTFVKGPFTARITLDYLLITEVACISSTSAIARRHALTEAIAEPTALIIRGAKPQTFTPALKKHIALSNPVDHVKRQSLTNAAGSLSVLAGEASRFAEQLFTVVYSIGVINSGADLGETCVQLQSANAILDLAQVGLNATQASTAVCAASSPDTSLAAFNQTVIASAAAGLYGIQLAANFTGTVAIRALCNQLNLSPLAAFGVDVNAIRTFICGADNATATASGTGSPSLGTMTPFPLTNSSRGSFSGTGSISGASSVSTTITAPWVTGRPASGTGIYPTINITAFPGNADSGTGVSGTDNVPTATGSRVNGTATHGTGGLPAASGHAGAGTAIYDASNSSACTGSIGSVISASATGGAMAGYASSGIEPWSSIPEHGLETSERLPYGPTSTPRYYPKYF